MGSRVMSFVRLRNLGGCLIFFWRSQEVKLRPLSFPTVQVFRISHSAALTTMGWSLQTTALLALFSLGKLIFLTVR